MRGLGWGPGRALVALPWQGPVPLDLTGGLPVYAWATALLGSLTPGQTWPGRVLSLGTSLLAAGLLFAIVRRLKGGRAGLYAALFLTLSPLGLYYGRAYLPDALNWLLSLLAVGAALRWRDSCMAARPRTALWFVVATAAAGLAIAAAPGNLAFLLPLLYIVWPRREYHPDYEDQVVLNPLHAQVIAFTGRRELLMYGLGALLPLLVWQVLVRVGGTVTATDWGLGGPGAALKLLTDGSFYTLLLDQVVNNLLTVLGFLLVLAGLSQRTRSPWPLVLYVWLGGALLGLLLQAPRLAADESALTPLLLPLAALAGVGAARLATLPAQIAAVLRGSAAGVDEEAATGGADFARGQHGGSSDAAPATRGRASPGLGSRRSPPGPRRRGRCWPAGCRTGCWCWGIWRWCWGWSAWSGPGCRACWPTTRPTRRRSYTRLPGGGWRRRGGRPAAGGSRAGGGDDLLCQRVDRLDPARRRIHAGAAGPAPSAGGQPARQRRSALVGPPDRLSRPACQLPGSDPRQGLHRL